MPNPYTPFTPAVENFFGREDILQVFRRRLKAGSRDRSQGRHILLVGDGGIGKTSLLGRLALEAQRGEQPAHTISIDIGDYAFDTASLVDDLCSQLPRPARPGTRARMSLGLSPRASKGEVFNKLLLGLRDGIAIGFPPSIELSPSALFHSAGRSKALARQIASWCADLLHLCSESQRPIVILVDQMGKLAHMPGGMLIAQALAEVMSVSVESGLSQLVLVLAVRPEQKGILEHHFRQEIFDPAHVARVPLYALGKEAATRAIAEPARRMGVALEPQLVSGALGHFGDHPYFLQIHCYRMWERLMAGGVLGQLTDDDLKQIVLEGQAAMYRDFSPEGRYVLRLLALNGPTPLTRMQIRERIEAGGEAHVVPADSALAELAAHKHRPLKYHESSQGYSLAHDLFADYILRHECSAEQQQIAVLQSILDNAPRAHAITGILLADAQMDRLWSSRDQLRWKREHVPVVVISEAKARGSAGRWAEWFLTRDETELRLAAAGAIRGRVSERASELLLRCLDEGNSELCLASQEALSKSKTPWTWSDEWDFEASAI